MVCYRNMCTLTSEQDWLCHCFQANQVMSYCHVFILLLIAFCMVVVCVMVLYHEYQCHCFGFSDTAFPCSSQHLNSRQNGIFHGHHIECLLGLPVPFSVRSTIITANVLINQGESYYVITSFYLVGIEVSDVPLLG